jgi:adenine-specific DNA-methyltransferase
LVSLSNETHHDTDHVCELLAERGHVGVVELQSKRYVGAQIGIHNPAGVRVGEVSHLTNSELLLLVGPDPVVIDRALGRAAEPAAA